MRSTRAEINLQALKYNFDEIKRRVGPKVKIMGIVKANAYGNGMIEIARMLVHLGIDYLGVAFVEEGIELRKQGVTTPALVLGGVQGSQIEQFLENDLDITLSSREIAERVNDVAGRTAGRKARVHL